MLALPGWALPPVVGAAFVLSEEVKTGVGIDVADLGAISGVTLGLGIALKLIDKWWDRKTAALRSEPTPSQMVCGYSEDDRHRIRRMSEQHDITDPDGMPVWYVPRSLDETLHALAGTLERVDRNQEAITKRLEEL